MPDARESVVVTGAGGFIGRRLVPLLGPRARALRLRGTDWRPEAERALREGVSILHLVGRVHDPRAGEADYRRDNVEKTRLLARLARERGARRIVFLSSIKVNGEETSTQPFRPDDAPRPQDAYARSKLAAEEALREETRGSAVEPVIVRSPLVYGRGAGGNLQALLRLADTPWPLPFAALDNRRSFIHVEDLCAALVACESHPLAAGRTYLVAHREAVSTCSLLTRIRDALRRPARLFGVAPALLESAAALAGEADRMRRLTRSLVIDPTLAEQDLGWVARRPLEEAVAEMVAGHRAAAAA